MLKLISAITKTEAESIVKPITQLISTLLPYILTVVGSIGLLYCIVIGVKYAKADDPQEHEKAKKGLKNAIVGFVLIFILIAILGIAMPILQNWALEYLGQ